MTQQGNTNWWEDAYNHDHKFSALWRNDKKLKTRRIDIELNNFIEAFSPNVIRVPIPVKGRQLSQRSDLTMVKFDFTFRLEW